MRKVVKLLKFKSIEYPGIFTEDFSPLTRNCEIEFPSKEEIAVIYGPNGTGKTSLVKVIEGAKGTKLTFEVDGVEYSSGTDIFYIISDQNSRNIIQGDTEDFFLGDNIKREFELQRLILKARASIIDQLSKNLKSRHGIPAANSPLISLINDADLAKMVRDIANNKSRGSNYSTDELVRKVTSITINNIEISQEQLAKLEFLKSDYAIKDSIIKQIENLATKTLPPNPDIYEVEENSEAIRILDHFQKDQCIVCDSENIDREALLSSKTKNRARIIESLEKEVQSLLKAIIGFVSNNDPFRIKQHLMEAICNGDIGEILSLMIDIDCTKKIYEQLVLNELSNTFIDSSIPEMLTEYNELLNDKPAISDDDMLYIQEIINNSMRKELTLVRDDERNLKITLANREFLGMSRVELPLSTGEQNFLSLTFEFLKAKNSKCPIVVIDDPISSFDSIYKNKVAYAIIKILHHKKRIILTHNTDLLRLLYGQHKKCFNLYFLNNTSGEENGFIPLNNLEREMLISIEKLIKTFRETIFDYIKDVRLFLMSVIPFMRGYANIIMPNSDAFKMLTQLMHGYENEKVDIGKLYTELFGNKNNVIPNSYKISVTDILATPVGDASILDRKKFNLLDKTLRHSLTYLYLRLLVERTLVEKFHINTEKYRQLGEIINAAFPDEGDKDQVRNRIKLTSKKTLINEFNHFEGNLSIFQPAIDITDKALTDERNDLLEFVSKL